MPPTAAMNDELFRALRDDAGMPEEAAAKVARLIFQRNESAARADREADREVFAAKGDVDTLKTKVESTDSAIERIDKRLDHMDSKFTKKFERLDETIVEIKETAARTDEKVNSLQSQNKTFIIPLSLLTLTALFGVIGLLIRLVMVGQ